MDRLLALKKAIIEYFRLHPSNARKLTSHEWTVTNEVCSLLDVVSEATTPIQGGEDTHVSQVMFIMTEVIELLKEDSHSIRVANVTVLPSSPDDIPTESTLAMDLTLEAQDVREILPGMVKDKGLGKASLKVERLYALLDPRWKRLGADQFANGSAALRTRAKQASRSCAGASDGRGQRKTCTQEEALEARGTARGTCKNGRRWWWRQRWGRASGSRHGAVRADWARGVGVLGGGRPGGRG